MDLRKGKLVGQIIGLLKQAEASLAAVEFRRRQWLKGALGDARHAILCGAGHNSRMILAHLRVLYFAPIALIALALSVITPHRQSPDWLASN